MGKVKDRKKLGSIDKPFLLTLLTIIGIGLVMVYSSSMYSSTINGQRGYSQFLRQALFAFGGLFLMYILSRIDYKILQKKNVYNALYLGALVLLALVLVIGVNVNGAKRWISLGIISFQPSELAKVAGIIYLSAKATEYPKLLNAPFVLNKTTWELWKVFFIPTALYCILTVAEPSLSATMVIALGMFCVLWFGGIRFKQFFPVILLALVGVGFLLLFVSWRFSRLLAFFGKGSVNYQINQSLLAFGSGGLFGVGLGNGKQKLLFLPEIQNDFIFANIGEEFGLIGCLVVLFLYGFLIYRGFQIGIRCKNKFGYLYTLSTMTILGFQVFVNIGVATGTIPVTGMALPFISYGGTSIVILLASVGPILNISRSVKVNSSKSTKKKIGNKNENSNGRRRNRRSYLSGNSNI